MAHMRRMVWTIVSLLLVNCLCNAQAGTWPLNGSQGKQRKLQQNFAQFSTLQDMSQSFGDPGGQWVFTPAGPPQPAAPAATPDAAAANGDSAAMRPTTVRSASNRRPPQTYRSIAQPSSGSSQPASSSSSSSSTREIGKFGAVTMIKPVTVVYGTGSAGRVPTGSTGAPGITRAYTGAPGGSVSADSMAAAAGTSNRPVSVNVGVGVPVDAADTQSATSITTDISSRAGTINGRTPPNLVLGPAVGRTLPRFAAQQGRFVTNGDAASWPSLNPESRINAVFLPDSKPANASGNSSRSIPPADSVVVYDPDPVNVTRLPAASFESGYCVPRVAYLVVNVTAHSCPPGSNLTKWDEEPVCARLDCRWRSPGTNVLNSGTGCRTVVERAKPICPQGCMVIEQLRWNTTVNRTQLFTKCSCKAGNQPCPSFWTACTCYEGFNSQNLTRGFVVCSETEEECDRKCNLAVAGNPRLAPLCPVAMDPFLSINPSAPPIYPSFGWGISSQARQTAVLGAAVSGRSLKQLVGWGRHLTAAAADWQLHKVLQPSPPASVPQGTSQGLAASGVPKPAQKPWLPGACKGITLRVGHRVGRALLQALTAGQQALRLG